MVFACFLVVGYCLLFAWLLLGCHKGHRWKIVCRRRLMFFEQAREQAEKDYSTNHQDTHVRASPPRLHLLKDSSFAGDVCKRQTQRPQTAGRCSALCDLQQGLTLQAAGAIDKAGVACGELAV